MPARKRGMLAKPTILGGTPADRKLPQRVRPFPEIIDETDWEVREGRYPSFIKRSEAAERPHIMQVPLGETAIDRKIRLHEQAHVAWTPPIREDDERLWSLREIDTLNATEDARIIELMNRTSEDWAQINRDEVGLLTPEMQKAFQDGFGRLSEYLKGSREAAKEGKVIKAPSKMMSLVEAARLIASTQGYAEGHMFEQMASSADLGWVTKEVHRMHTRHILERAEPTFEDAIAYALELEEFFEGAQREIEEQNAALAEAGMDRSGWSKRATPAPSKPVFTPPTLHKRGKGKAIPVQEGFGSKPVRTRGQGRWGQLTIIQKPLVDKLAAREGRKIRPADVGAVPRYMHRLLTDQRVFGRRRKKKAFQGTVLIDCSGSMHLTPEMVDDILRRWPAVTVATYAGYDSRGELWIVAKKGKRARPDDIKPPGGGNVVDGPCLDWLAKQRMPRIWISDGGVTGVGDNSSYDFIKDAALKMKRGKIKRLGNAQALLAGAGSEEYYDYAE